VKCELIVRRVGPAQYDITDSADETFELREISEAQLLGYLKNRRLLETTAEAVIQQLNSVDRRSEIRVLIDRTL
jgi:hypothetical protein